MDQTPEQRELALVGKVEMRIALANSDVKLESTLKTYLAPLLLKLASEHQSVRNKVVSICQHITTRIKPHSIQLPVASLIKQFKDQQSPLIRHFDLLYIQHGVGRLSPSEQTELVPTVVQGFAGSGSHGPQIFHLLLRLLEVFPFHPRGSKEDVELRTRMEVADHDAEYLASWLGKLILFVPQRGTNSNTCPGLSPEDYAFLTLQNKEDTWSPALGGLNVTRTKILATKLLVSGLFKDSERFFPALFASADPASAISDAGDDMLKRALPSIDLEDEQIVTRLYELYFGSDKTPRVKVALRLRILGLLNKSNESTAFAEQITNLVDDGITIQSTDGDDIIMGNITNSNNQGREAIKLRSAVFTFINFVATHGPHDTLHAIAPRVIIRLRDFIDNQGWPKAGSNEDFASRGYAYEVIGLLAKVGPHNILFEDEEPTLDLIRWLFESLAKDSSGSSTVVSIEESLSTVLSGISRRTLSSLEASVLEDLLIDQMELSSDLNEKQRLRSTRFVALRFANRCLPYASVKARWVDLLGLDSSGDKAEVHEEAERGLSPYWYRMLNGIAGNAESSDVIFPTFSKTMDQFFPSRTVDAQTEPAVIVRQVELFHNTCFRQLTTFCRRILYQQALQQANVAIKVDNDWERRLDIAIENDVTARAAVKLYLDASIAENRQDLEVLQFALFQNLVGKTAVLDQHIVYLVALSPTTLVTNLVPEVSALVPALHTNDWNQRVIAARLFGMLASDPAAAQQLVLGHCHQLLLEAQKWESAYGSASNYVHGAVVALGYFYSRSAYRSEQIPQQQGFDSYVQLVFTLLTDSRDDRLQEAAHVALGELCMYRALATDIIEKTLKLRTIVDKLYGFAKEGTESAIRCLGQLSMIIPEDMEGEDSDLCYLEEQLHKLHEIKQAEVHFTVGEAFSYLAFGWSSGALATKLDCSGPQPRSQPRTFTTERLISRILKDCVNTKPALKKAAVMWLLCLVQSCGEHAGVQTRLPQFQTAFKRCLADRDELVQETASRGLGVVYEKGNRELKDDLVRDLVSSFSSDKQSQLAGNVSADTQLFERGALPTGDGSVSTYKDIMSLASEVGDSSLVYRFMSMASSNAIWSSRAAFGRFGLSNVLSDSSVEGYLSNNPKLYPKLFRYRFDPNGGVQRSMNHIWNSLVKDSTGTINLHFDAIMEDLLTNILGKEWRVRQACCAAIADLVSGRSLDKYERYLERIWTQCFKVLDDIKESVRAAAASLARTLTGNLTRSLEADHTSTKDASVSLQHVIPFLLSPSGMESSAKDVQTFAIVTLMEIIKKANGKTLRPFIPELIERLIGLLSSLEPEAVNYIHLNASKYNLTEQKIDDMRLSSVRSSPLMEAIERCIDLLDEDSIKQLKPRLENAMKSAVGLPSKVGSSRVLVSLSTRRMQLFAPHSDDALKLIQKLVLDRNETVSSSYAVAAGYVARAASESEILRLIKFAQKLYFDSEGDREGTTPHRAISAGEIMYALSKYASDRFNSVAASALPFVFVAKHDPHEVVKDQFQNAWNDSVGGSRAVLLYIDEILTLCSAHIGSPQWTLKHTAAWAVADVVMAVSSTQTKVSEDIGAKIWPVLEKALGGKTWEGKETVLVAFVKFVEIASSYYSQQPGVKSLIIKVATREAKRQNAIYRPHAFKAIGQISLSIVDEDMSQLVLDIVKPFLAMPDEEDKMEVDGDGSKIDTMLTDATRNAAAESLFASINPNKLQGHALSQAVNRAMQAVTPVMPQSTAALRRSVYSGVASMLGRIEKQEATSGLQLDAETFKSVLFGYLDETEALRTTQIDAVVALQKACPALIATELRENIKALMEGEKSATLRARLARILQD